MAVLSKYSRKWKIIVHRTIDEELNLEALKSKPPPFTDEETGAWRDVITCPKSHWKKAQN